MSVENEPAKPYLIQGLWPHEIALLALLATALYYAQSDYHVYAWPAYIYGAALLAAFPALWWRLREEWRNLPNLGLFAGLAAVWVALFAFLGISTFRVMSHPSLFFWMFNVWTSPFIDEEHGVLMPFVVLILIWCKRRELAAQPVHLWWPGMALVALGLVMHVAGYVVEQPRLSVMAFFVGLYGIMGLIWGPRWLKTILFPYFLLAFCVPLAELGIALTLQLRIMVATIVAFISQHGLAPDVQRVGTQLMDSQHTFGYEVAPACSGIHSLVAMLALSIIYSFLNFRSPWKRLVMAAAAVPLAIACNVARLCFTIFISEFLGQGAGKAVESYTGFVTFAVAIIGVISLGRWLEQSGSKPNLEAIA